MAPKVAMAEALRQAARRRATLTEGQKHASFASASAPKLQRDAQRKDPATLIAAAMPMPRRQLFTDANAATTVLQRRQRCSERYGLGADLSSPGSSPLSAASNAAP
jgi:hypothetical protein